MDSVTDDRFLICRVSPFGNLRIDAYVPLPGAYRSLSRPSSAPDAKAFPLRSFSLNLVDADFAHFVSASGFGPPAKTPYRALRRLRQSLLTPLRLLFLADLHPLGGRRELRAHV